MPDLSLAFLATPEGWAAMVTLVAMEVVLGIDNLIFISILTNKLPPETPHRKPANFEIGAALIMRLLLLSDDFVDRRVSRADHRRLRDMASPGAT